MGRIQVVQTWSADVAAHEADTTNIHGIADTSLLATKAYADAEDVRLAKRQGELLAGNYYWAPPASGNSAGAVVKDQVTLLPLYIPNATTVIRLGASITGAGGASSVVRFGLFTIDFSTLVATRVVDAGTIDGTSATVQEVTLNSPATEGLIWTASCWQVGTAGNMDRSNQGSPYFIPKSTIPTAGDLPTCMAATGVTGAFPSTLNVARSTSFPARVFIKTS